ncbi:MULTISPECIES: hypothetical protein [unclassified Frankia]|uniref:hypothetical protein n=1 Tax=unclassified Frankia TaxID=2632575 RepID=UPI0020242F70
MDTPSDLERSRLLLVWLQARRAVDRCLSDLLAAGPAGERRVREQLGLVDDLESRAREAFVQYRAVVLQSLPDTGPADTADIVDWEVPLDTAGRPRLGVVRTGQPGPDPEREQVTGTAPNTGSVPGSGAGLGRSASGSRTDLGRTVSGPTPTIGARPPRDSARPGTPAATAPAGGASGPPGSPTGITGATGTVTGRPSPAAPAVSAAPSARPSASLPSAPLPSARVIPLVGRDREADITRGTRAIRGSQRRHR